MAGQRIGRFEITPDLLFYYWPKEMHVLAVRVVGFHGGNLEILIEHPDLKPAILVEGESAPRLRPTFRREVPAVELLADAPTSGAGTTIDERCVILTLAERDALVEAIRGDVPEFTGWGQD